MKAFLGAFFLMFSQGVLAYMLPLKVMELGHDTQTSGLLLSTFGIVAILVFVLPINNVFDIIKANQNIDVRNGYDGGRSYLD